MTATTAPADFNGRAVIVTGAAQGIGRAVALRLHRGGAAVAVLDRDLAGARAVAEGITAAGGHALALRCDLTRDREVAAAIADAVETFGHLDALHANAGIQRYGTALQVSEAEWDELLDANVKATFLTVRHALPHLVASGHGSVCLTSSVQAFATQRGVVHYTTSKAALVGMCRALAVDHAAQGVRVNCVCPGSVDTPMLRAAAARFAGPARLSPDDLVRRWGQSHPLGRVGTADEVAEVVAFLLSDRAAFVTGVAVPVDGGLSAQLGAILPE